MKQRKVADHSNSIAGLSMMASALAGRTLEVKYDEARVGAAWTDGKIVYVTSDGDLKCPVYAVVKPSDKSGKRFRKLCKPGISSTRLSILSG